jgi:hypothetical protein
VEVSAPHEIEERRDELGRFRCDGAPEQRRDERGSSVGWRLLLVLAIVGGRRVGTEEQDDRADEKERRKEDDDGIEQGRLERVEIG